MDELEPKPEGEKANSPTKSGDSTGKSPSKEALEKEGAPDGLPTPPSDAASETPPKNKAEPTNKTSPTTPIKLKIRRSVEKGRSKLTSSLQVSRPFAPDWPEALY